MMCMYVYIYIYMYVYMHCTVCRIMADQFDAKPSVSEHMNKILRSR